MTRKLYLAEGALVGTTVVSALVPGERPAVQLRETWFHPQGGGQRGDRGWIGGGRVVDTRHGADGEVDHFLESLGALTVGATVTIQVDAEHRDRSARLHSAGHLIADAVHAVRPALRAMAGHHWDGEARVEFEGLSAIDAHLQAEVEQSIEELILADLPITVTGDPFASRAIRIGGFTPVGCGGTHVSSTGVLAGLRISGLKMKGHRLRVSYLCS